MEARGTQFFHRLESLRGIAAMMVACSHALLLFRVNGSQAVIARCLTVVCSGWAGVTLFFVLSGFVLGLAIRRIDSDVSMGLVGYVIRRVFRIYPVFLFSTLLLACWVYFGAALFPGISRWLGEPHLRYAPSVLNHNLPMTFTSIARNLLMLDASLNPVSWTLKVEMICSLLLPVFHYLVRRFTSRGKVLVLLALVWVACLGKSLLLVGFADAEAFFDATVFKYVFLFYLGYLLPEAGPFLVRKAKTNSCLAGLLLAVGVALFFGAGVLNFAAFTDDLRIVQGFAAALILCVIVYGAPLPALNVLDHPVVTFYGRISYSFYLWHYLVLVAVFRYFFPKAPYEFWLSSPLMSASAFWFASAIVATPIAWLSFSLLEKPFIDLSKKICLRLVPSQISFRVATHATQ
jgi:peptidoglycan/LPS O-acetylase OafA/YrhL